MKQLTAALAASLLLGCPQILRNPSSTTEGAWTLSLKGVADGPDYFQENQLHYSFAGKDMRFLWIEMSVRNDTPQKRRWAWSSCDLDIGEDVLLPSFIVAGSVFARLVREVEAVEPGEVVERRLVFAYPEKLSPRRLVCKNARFPLELEQ